MASIQHSWQPQSWQPAHEYNLLSSISVTPTVKRKGTEWVCLALSTAGYNSPHSVVSPWDLAPTLWNTEGISWGSNLATPMPLYFSKFTTDSALENSNLPQERELLLSHLWGNSGGRKSQHTLASFSANSL